MGDVRTARTEDIPALTVLIERSVGGLLGPVLANVPLWLAEVFGMDTQLIADGTYYVIDAVDGGGRLAAAGGWGRRRTLYGGDNRKQGAAPPLDPAVDAARIRHFYVDPDFARRGLATRLLVHAENAARAAGFRRIELLATPTGEPLYRRHGYGVIAYEPVRLSDGSSFSWPVMAKTFSSCGP